VTTDGLLVVWQSTSALTGDELAAAVALLSDEERARVDRLRFADVARDYAAAHALLRRVLSHGRRTPPRDWRFGRTPTGKPFLLGEAGMPSFSLSHTRGLVACAVAADHVGVDVEATDRIVDVARIAARFFSAAERADLHRLDERAAGPRFFDVWTLKEALVKACGRELSSSVHELAFRIDDDSDQDAIHIAASPGIDPARWQFALCTPAPAYRLAIAAHHEPGRLRSVTIVNASEAAF
jgi:phosphopantetheine--protein transferase-like protein